MSQQSHQPSLLNRIARVLLCLVFIHAVIGKLTGFAGVAGAIAAKGLPLAPVLLVAAMALMAVGSALVISGWKAPLGVVLLLVFLIPTTLIFHGDVADKIERIQLFKNLAIIAGLLLVADQDSRCHSNIVSMHDANPRSMESKRLAGTSSIVLHNTKLIPASRANANQALGIALGPIHLKNDLSLCQDSTSTVFPFFGYNVRVVERPPTWRGYSYSVTYLMSEREPTVTDMIDVHRWAKNENLPNPRIIPPSLLQWSSLFNPRFFSAVAAERGGWESRLSWTFPDEAPKDGELAQLWLQTKLFLAGVTLSAAIIQSRYSQGTIASKYDHLWEAGVLAESAVVQGLRELDLRGSVYALSSDIEADDVERMMEVRKQFMAAWAIIAPTDGDVELMTEARIPAEYADRFGFVDELRSRCGPGLHAIIVYGSSVSSQSFADYDLLVVTENPEGLLRRLAGQSPKWCAKEMNMGIYSPDELIVMQRLSGDNLADYGVCLWGVAPVVRKPVSTLLIRNFSFGVVRQRQQLGILSRAIFDPKPADVDGRRNLYDYFVKIPANVAKGTLGALGERWSKERVQEWMMTELGFDTVGEQRRAELGYPSWALASSALATGKVISILNERVQLVRAPRRATAAPPDLH